jgi:hypothetical protein
MTNMMAKIFNAVGGQVVRWVGAIVIAAGIAARSMLALIRHAGLASLSTGVVPAVGQQLLDSAVELRGQSCQHILEVGPRVVPAQLGALQQAHHHGSSFAGQLTAYEQPVFAIMVS